MRTDKEDAVYFTFLPLLYLFTVLGGLAVSIRYRHLAAHIPLIIVGFVVEALTHLLPSLSGFLVPVFSFLGLPNGAQASLSVSSGLYSVLPLFSVGGWALVVAGFCLALREFDQKLTVRDIDRNISHLNVAPQRNATDTYHEPPACYSQSVHPQSFHSHPAQFTPAQEEIYATAFAASPASSAVSKAPSLPMGSASVQPVRIVAVEQSEHAVTLGSSG